MRKVVSIPPLTLNLAVRPAFGKVKVVLRRFQQGMG